MRRRIAHLFTAQNLSFLILSDTNFLPCKTRHYSSSSASITSRSTTSNNQLSQDEVEKINLLLPRLCESNHLDSAIRLIDTVLLTPNPPLPSISLPILIDQLAEQPTMTESMSLLNRLKHNPSAHPFLLHINKLLIISYINKHKLKEATKIISWMSRPDSPCVVDEMVCRIMVKGLCRKNLTVEALRVVKKMVEDKVVIGGDVRGLVYRSLLREARVREAQELNEGLTSYEIEGGNGEEGQQRVLRLLDQLVSNWTE